MSETLSYTPSKPIEAFQHNYMQDRQSEIVADQTPEQLAPEQAPPFDLHRSHIDHAASHAEVRLPEGQTIVHASIEKSADQISRMLENMVVVKHAA